MGVLHGVGLLELMTVLDVVTRLTALAADIPLRRLIGCGGGSIGINAMLYYAYHRLVFSCGR